jgi:hypothetical protein
MIDEKQWRVESKWESDWWGNCVNTYREEGLQFAYARRMGLTVSQDSQNRPSFDMQERSVIDFGGGPVSMLLKTRNAKKLCVVDPCDFPTWVRERYRAAGILYLHTHAEYLTDVERFNEAWIYNVLQHTMDPKLIIDNAKKAARTIRIFEWIDAGIAPGHPHELHEQELNDWLHGKGTVEEFEENGSRGRCYYGVF